MKRDRGADNAEPEERRIQSRLQVERRILEMQIEMKKKEYSLLNDCKFSKTKLPNAHVRNITSLPQINNANPQKIHDFSGKLLCSVQALDTMGKIKEMNGYVRVTLDKRQGIRVDLV